MKKIFAAISNIPWFKILIQNSLAMLLVCIGFFLAYKTWTVIYHPVLEVVLMHGLSTLIAIAGALVILGLTISSVLGRRKLTGFERGKLFCLSMAGVLFSYAISWHLYFSFFLYKHMLFLIGVSIMAVIQAYIWSREMIDKSVSDTSAYTSRRFQQLWLIPILVLALMAVIVGTIVSIRTVRFEDLFITFRYGWNLAQGHGINWNVSDPIPAEGYTTFTYVLLSALFFATHIDPIIGAQIANIFSLCILAFLTWLLARIIFDDSRGLQSLLAVAMLIATPATVFHIGSGMETIFYAATLAGISYFAIRWLKRNQDDIRAIYGLGIAILISGLTRPDGIVYGGITLIMLLLLARKKFARLQNLVALGLTLIVPGSVYFLWRLSYFQSLLPLSFYHKSFVGDLYGHATRNVLFTDFVGMILLPYIALILYRLVTRSYPKEAYLLLAPAFVLVLYYSRVLAVAGLQYRFFFPYLFPFLIVVAEDFATTLNFIATKVGRVLAPILCTVLVFFIVVGPFFYEARNTVNFFSQGLMYNENDDNYTQIGKALLNIDPSQPIGIGEVGKIGMLLRDYTVIDVVGLNDRYLARHPFSTKYLDERGVNILITFPYPRASLGVYADVYRKLGEDFGEIEQKFVCTGHIRGLDVFVRNDPVIVRKMLAALNQSKDFKEGVCLSDTASRWAPKFVKLTLDDWSVTDMKLIEANGVFKFRVTGNDPILRSPTLNLAADEYYNVMIRMTAPPPIECSTLVLYFTRSDAPTETDEHAIRYNFQPSDTPQTIVLNVRNNPEWRDTIEHLRVDPVCGLNKGGPRIFLEIESIVLH